MKLFNQEMQNKEKPKKDGLDSYYTSYLPSHNRNNHMQGVAKFVPRISQVKELVVSVG